MIQRHQAGVGAVIAFLFLLGIAIVGPARAMAAGMQVSPLSYRIVDSANTESLRNCIAELGVEGGFVIFRDGKTHRLKDDLSIPKSITLVFQNGSRLMIDPGIQLFHHGRIVADPYQVFIGGESIQFDYPQVLIKAAWWGHKPSNDYLKNDKVLQDVMRMLPVGGRVQMGGGTFYHQLIEVGNRVTLQGLGIGRTIVKLPDHHPNILTHENFITAKSGIETCTIEDLEYNGNAANNRDQWTRPDFDRIKAHGIYFGPLWNRVVPSGMVYLKNLYIHDTVRGLVTDARVDARFLHIKNSDTDHLIYGAKYPCTFSDILLEGYWAGPAIVGFGQSFERVTVKNIEANPTEYLTGIVIGARSTSSPARQSYGYKYIGPTRVKDLSVEVGPSATELSTGIQTQQVVEIEGATFSFVHPFQPDGFSLFSVRSYATETQGPLMLAARNITVKDAPDSFILVNFQGDRSISDSGTHIDGVNISYRGTADKTIRKPLAFVQDHVGKLSISNVTLRTDSADLVRIATADLSIGPVVFENVTMLDNLQRTDYLFFLRSGADYKVRGCKLYSGRIDPPDRPKVRFERTWVGDVLMDDP